jgi:hypothetical protein
MCRLHSSYSILLLHVSVNPGQPRASPMCQWVVVVDVVDDVTLNKGHLAGI